MITDTDLFLMLPRTLHEVPGADQFNAKVKPAHDEQKALSGIFGEAKKAEREIRVNALVKLCARLNAERARLMHAQSPDAKPMEADSLFTKATGPNSLSHNNAVKSFRTRLYHARIHPLKAVMQKAQKHADYVQYYTGCNRPPRYSDKPEYELNLALERLATVENGLRGEYKALQATRDQLNNRRKGIKQ